MTRLAGLYRKIPTKIKLCKSLVNTTLQMWELDADYGFGETNPNPSLWNKCNRRMLGISYREYKIKWIHMATDQYPRRTSGTFIVNRQTLLWFGHACHHDMLPKTILQERVDGICCRGRLPKSCRTTSEWIDRPVIVVVAVHHRWQKSTGDHCITVELSAWVPKWRLGVMGVS